MLAVTALSNGRGSVWGSWCHTVLRVGGLWIPRLNLLCNYMCCWEQPSMLELPCLLQRIHLIYNHLKVLPKNWSFQRGPYNRDPNQYVNPSLPSRQCFRPLAVHLPWKQTTQFCTEREPVSWLSEIYHMFLLPSQNHHSLKSPHVILNAYCITFRLGYWHFSFMGCLSFDSSCHSEHGVVLF